jgi:hypothetical protein
VREAVQHIESLLKPGGHVYFSEHLGCAKGTWKRRFQDTLNPLWCLMMGGCNCNHDSLYILRNETNWDVVHWTFDNFKVAMGPFVMGLAYKLDAVQKDKKDS